MSGELLSSKVVVVEEEPRVRGIPSAPTSVASAVGVTQRGPVDVAVLCSSFDEFQANFGGFTPDTDLALAAMGFFENGGTQLWCCRTVHHKSIDDPSTATAVRAAAYLTSPGAPTPARVTGTAPAPLVLDDGDKLVISVAGGPDQTVTISAAAAFVAAGGPGPYALADGQALGVRIDGGAPQQIAFAAMDFVAIGSATPAEVAVSLNAKLVGAKAVVIGGVPRIVSDTKGAGSRVEIIGGNANGALAFATAPALGKGNVASARATTVDEVKAIAEPAIAGIVVSAAPGGFLDVHTTATGPGAQLQVRAATAAGFGLDTAAHTGSASGAANALRVEGKHQGAYANHVEIEVRAPASGEAGAFDVAVIEDGTYREVFPSLRMTPTAPRYVETIINDPTSGSALVRVTDQLLAGNPPLTIQTVALSGGDDGLVGLADTDFVGSPTGRTGLHAFDRIPDISLLLVPGRATPAVQNAMLRYCEVDRDGTMFAVLDPPAGQSAVDIVTYVESTAALLGLSEFGAMYWPRVKVLNPDRGVFGAQDKIVVPPSGIVAGVYARTDAARPGGVYDPPAGIDAGRLFGVLGFETEEVLEERKRDLVYPKRINPLTTGPGLPRYIDGSRTLKGDGNFPYIAERRGVIFIERSLKQGLQFARHKNNTEGLRATVRRTITAFLLTQMNNGAFRSREPAKAFFVDVSDLLNTPTVIFAGKLLARIGLATNKPAEFVVLRISQDTRALEAELAAAGG
jgi:phage tail sheath protein FI